MEHPCQQCGTTVEDGRPFCPQCHAPQIHVQVANPEAGIGAGLNPGPSEAYQGIPNAGYPARPSNTAGAIDRRIAVRAALKAGALGIFIAVIPFFGMVLTGALAVVFYRRESKTSPPAALGSRLGGAAGIVVFAVNALFTILIIVLHAQQKCVDAMVAMAKRFGVDASDPNFQTGIHNLLTPSGIAISFFVALVFASVGGALASLFLRPRNPPA